MDLWLGQIATFLNVEENSEFRTEIPTAGGRFLLTGIGCKARTGNNYTHFRLGKSPAYFMIANRSKEGKIMCAQALSTM